MGGLLGGGAFRNNRPLVLLLHLLLQPADSSAPLRFHHPVFWSFSCHSNQTLQQRILTKADEMMEILRQKSVSNLRGALAEILSWKLPTSEWDNDLTSDLFAPQE